MIHGCLPARFLSYCCGDCKRKQSVVSSASKALNVSERVTIWNKQAVLYWPVDTITKNITQSIQLSSNREGWAEVSQTQASERHVATLHLGFVIGEVVQSATGLTVTSFLAHRSSLPLTSYLSLCRPPTHLPNCSVVQQLFIGSGRQKNIPRDLVWH